MTDDHLTDDAKWHLDESVECIMFMHDDVCGEAINTVNNLVNEATNQDVKLGVIAMELVTKGLNHAIQNKKTR